MTLMLLFYWVWLTHFAIYLTRVWLFLLKNPILEWQISGCERENMSHLLVPKSQKLWGKLGGGVKKLSGHGPLSFAFWTILTGLQKSKFEGRELCKKTLHDKALSWRSSFLKLTRTMPFKATDAQYCFPGKTDVYCWLDSMIGKRILLRHPTLARHWRKLTESKTEHYRWTESRGI